MTAPIFLFESSGHFLLLGHHGMQLTTVQHQKCGFGEVFREWTETIGTLALSRGANRSQRSANIAESRETCRELWREPAEGPASRRGGLRSWQAARSRRVECPQTSDEPRVAGGRDRRPGLGRGQGTLAQCRGAWYCGVHHDVTSRVQNAIEVFQRPTTRCKNIWQASHVTICRNQFK